MREAEGENGFKSSSSSEGTSVASAKDAKESMIRFTHSIWTAVRGLSWTTMAPVQAVITATTFTTSCMQRRASWPHSPFTCGNANSNMYCKH